MSATTTVQRAPAPAEPKALTRRRLVASCPDQPGIIAAISRFLHDAGANIIQSDQYSSDPFGGTFFIRMEFAGTDDVVSDLAERFGAVAERFGMTWRFGNPDRPKRVAILVSKRDHCLQDLLYRWRRKELEAEVVLVASNHPATARPSRRSAFRSTTSRFLPRRTNPKLSSSCSR